MDCRGLGSTIMQETFPTLWFRQGVKKSFGSIDFLSSRICQIIRSPLKEPVISLLRSRRRQMWEILCLLTMSGFKRRGIVNLGIIVIIIGKLLFKFLFFNLKIRKFVGFNMSFIYRFDLLKLAFKISFT